MAMRSLDHIVANAQVEKVREIPFWLYLWVSAKYDELRKAFFKTYELVRKAYRQKFKNGQKQDGQTYVEFVRE